MYTVLLVIHSILVLFLIGLILLQRSDSDGLSGLGGGGNLLSGRAAGNMMTRATAVLATLFILSSLGLTVLGAQHSSRSIADEIVDTPATAPAKKATDKAEKPAAKETAPSVPKPE